MALHNDPSLASRRRTLRANLTPAEATLWTYLQNSQLSGRKFRRQHSIGHYIVDFYCPQEQLAIELDGAAHDSEKAFAKAMERDRILGAQNIRVIRFENRLIFENPEGVLQEIQKCFKHERKSLD